MKSSAKRGAFVKRFTHKTYALGFTLTEEDLMNDADRMPGWIEWRQAVDLVQYLHFWAPRLGWELAVKATMREFGERQNHDNT